MVDSARDASLALAADRYVVVCTVPDAATGEVLARALVTRRLAACVNRVPGVRSVYRWEGAIHEDGEELLLIKTDERHLAALIAAIEAEHPYDCPEVLALPVAAGSLPYLSWIATSLD